MPHAGRNLLLFSCFLLLSTVAWSQERPPLGTEPVGTEPAAFRFRPHSATIPPGEVDLPLRAGSPVPIIEIKVNGQGPFAMVVDLGSREALQLDSHLIQGLSLKVIARMPVSEVGAVEAPELDIVHVTSASIGAAEFQDLDAPVRELAEFWPGTEPVNGIVGVELFAKCLLTLDYPAGRCRLAQGELPPVDGKEILSLVENEPIPAVEMRLAEIPALCYLDTGSTTGVALTTRLASQLSWASELRSLGEVRGLARRGTLQQGRMADSIFVGRHELKMPLVSVIDFLAKANFGSDVLRHFTLSLDWKNHRVRLARAGQEPITFEARYIVGVLLQRSQDELLVEQVIPGSAAEAAGIKAGDRIAAVNGKPLAELEAGEIRDAFGRPNPVTLTIDRDGKTVEIVVTPRRSDE